MGYTLLWQLGEVLRKNHTIMSQDVEIAIAKQIVDRLKSTHYAHAEIVNEVMQSYWQSLKELKEKK